MQVPTALAVLFFAIGAAALPHDITGPTVGPDGNAVCGNGQSIHCCNKSSVNNGKGGLLGVGSILDGVFGTCSPLTIPVIGVAVPVNKACGDNQAACCTGAHNGGIVDLSCTNVAVI
ncbi:hypothetical protein V492_00623 [Pseudogymnoascus sp. VKM F-4246]|nr:hypothetical protein V492_00623 [Pseudogymnoascus sp. VKM F-4246]